MCIRDSSIYRNISRASQTFGARLRTGHLVTESYLNRFHLSDSPMCKVCNEEEDIIEHTLLNCTGQCEELSLIHISTSNEAYDI